MIKIVSRFSLSIILIVGGYLGVAGQPRSTDPKPIKAVEGIIEVQEFHLMVVEKKVFAVYDPRVNWCCMRAWKQ